MSLYTCTKCDHVGAPLSSSALTVFAASMVVPGLGHALRGHWGKAIGVFVFTPLFAWFMGGFVYGGLSSAQLSHALTAAIGMGLLTWIAAAYSSVQVPDYNLRCAVCHQRGVIPADSPRGRALGNAAASASVDVKERTAT